MPEVGADNEALKGLYLEGAAFKAQIIEALGAAGIPVHAIKHSGEFHVVQIPTPPRLQDPHLFAAWFKNQAAAASAVPEK